MDYIKHFNRVDMSDADGAFWGIQPRSKRWYMHIVYWLWTKLFSAIFIVAQKLGTTDQESVFAKYVGTGQGLRRAFIIDVCTAVTERAVREAMAHSDELRGTRYGLPRWVRQEGHRACDCRTCYCYKEGMVDSTQRRRESGTATAGTGTESLTV